MRKTLAALATIALVAAPMTSAEAASKYRVSAGVSDNKLDLTSHDGSNRSTHIKGRVKGGKVKGKKVYFYVSNTSARNQKYRYIGSDKLSSSGRFDKKWKPKDGGNYRVKVVKKSGDGRRAGQDLTRVYVFKFVDLAYFYAGGNGVTRPDKAGRVGGVRDPGLLVLPHQLQDRRVRRRRGFGQLPRQPGFHDDQGGQPVEG
jgi:hypothetical protein